MLSFWWDARLNTRFISSETSSFSSTVIHGDDFDEALSSLLCKSTAVGDVALCYVMRKCQLGILTCGAIYSKSILQLARAVCSQPYVCRKNENKNGEEI